MLIYELRIFLEIPTSVQSHYRHAQQEILVHHHACYPARTRSGKSEKIPSTPIPFKDRISAGSLTV